MRLSASAEPSRSPLRFRAEEKCVLFLMPSNIHMLNRSQRKRLAGLSPDLSFPSGRGRTSTWSHLLGQHSPQLPFRPGCGHTYRMGSMILLPCLFVIRKGKGSCQQKQIHPYILQSPWDGMDVPSCPGSSTASPGSCQPSQPTAQPCSFSQPPLTS